MYKGAYLPASSPVFVGVGFIDNDHPECTGWNVKTIVICDVLKAKNIGDFFFLL